MASLEAVGGVDAWMEEKVERSLTECGVEANVIKLVMECDGV